MLKVEIHLVTSKSWWFNSDKFKSGGIYEKHAVATWALRIISIAGRRKKCQDIYEA
jgi:hypothetical protein